MSFDGSPLLRPSPFAAHRTAPPSLPRTTTRIPAADRRSAHTDACPRVPRSYATFFTAVTVASVPAPSATLTACPDHESPHEREHERDRSSSLTEPRMWSARN